ncbi:MAG: HD domain-containing protein [Alphaproteobacteria bacterium]|nr:HD domain-containing protein [Alphaproteobacteria bacterium]
MDKIDELIALYQSEGAAQYGREAVTQAQHALQCAALAEAEGAAPALVAAALLHDVGHLLARQDRDPAKARKKDDKHEDIGSGYLKDLFGLDVAEPVRLHVGAKRYLCTVEPVYFDILSPASVRSLELQGGRLAEEQVEAFRGNRYAEDAVRLRCWDDRAKVAGAPTRTIGEYADLLRRLGI